MKKRGQSFETWLRTDEILGYVINAYSGIEPISQDFGKMRRVFLWEEEGEVKMGNAEAFVLHLGRRFNRVVKAGETTLLHKLLRDLGDSIAPHKNGHAKPRPDSPKRGTFKQPVPDEWTIRKIKSN